MDKPSKQNALTGQSEHQPSWGLCSLARLLNVACSCALTHLRLKASRPFMLGRRSTGTSPSSSSSFLQGGQEASHN